MSPQASLTFDATRSTRLYAGWSQHVQYPDLTQSLSLFAVSGLLPLRSTHATAAVEQRLGDRTRLRLEFYNRQDRDLPFRPLREPRVLGRNNLWPGQGGAVLSNSLRGYSRGWQVFLQRRSANRFMGWLSYSHGRAVLHDDFFRLKFHSDFDQRHTLNAYGGYRLRPSLHLSGKFTYGSGFPIPGFLRQGDATPLLAAVRNDFRLPVYARADVRVNKEFTHRRWKWTLYFEALNVTNRKNRRLDEITGWDLSTRRVFVKYTDLLPFLPAAGASFEW